MGGVGGRGRGMSIGRERQEEVSLRKAASETQLFWNHVGRNRGTRTYRPSKPQTRSREETSLFGSSTEILLGFVGDAIPVERSGPGCEDIPVLEAFSELVDLPPFLTRNIRLMRYDRPTPIQKHSVPLGMAGLDLMCCAQTVRHCKYLKKHSSCQIFGPMSRQLTLILTRCLCCRALARPSPSCSRVWQPSSHHSFERHPKISR